MKNLFLFLIIFGIGQSTFAQITYNASDYVAIGDELVYSRALNVDIGNAFEQNGGNQIWDYSQLVSIGVDTIIYFDPNDSGYQFSYCLSNGFLFNCQAKYDDLTNIAELGVDSFNLGDFNAQNVTRHFKLTEDKFSETMLGVTAQLEGIDVPVAIDFEEEDVIINFPLQYENQDSSESIFELDLSTVGFNAGIKRRRSRVNTVEGFGKLITPAKTYDEVLKVKSVINNIDTSFLDSLTIPLSTMEVEYKWYAKGEKGYVMQASGLIFGGNEVISNIQFKGTATTTNVGDLDEENLNFNIYPNPFQEIVQIKSESQENFDLIVFDILGRKVIVRNDIAPGESIDLSELIPGNYYFRVQEKEAKDGIIVPLTKSGF